jgi:hypothetical protein
VATFLDLDTFRATPLVEVPFQFVIVPGFVKRQARAALEADFPRIRHAGSLPLNDVAYGPGFAAFLAELRGPEFQAAVSEKFGLDLSGRPTMVTVRGRARKRDGRIHTDTATKIITVLIYLNDAWGAEGGRLRLLRRSDDLDDMVAEVPPEWGNLIAFRRSENSFHGHKPFEGPRRVVQLNWVTDQAVVDREVSRHKLSARVKRLLPWLGGY